MNPDNRSFQDLLGGAKTLTADHKFWLHLRNVFGTYCGAPENLSVSSYGMVVFGAMTDRAAKFIKFVMDKYRLVEA